MKKIQLIILILISYFSNIIAKASDLKEQMIPNSNTIGIDSEGTGVITQILIYIKDFLFSILGIIAIGVFLYFGFKLITAKGNEEEFKKTMMGFIYAIIGLAIIPLAWTIVKIISTLNF